MFPTYFSAPLAGHTDLPFRRACRQFGLIYAYTPLIDSGALVYGNPDNPYILARGAEEPWLGAQILGSRIDHLRQGGAMLNQMEFDTIDFNMGCPVKKVLRRDAGAGLLKDLEHAIACVQALREVIDKPLTVKTRIISEVDPEPTIVLARRLLACGIDGLTIHGRLASRVYAGPVAMSVIKAVRDSLPGSFPLTANGGIFTLADAQTLHRETGCDRLMVARGAIGNPWLFRDLLTGEAQPLPTHDEVCHVLQQHIQEMIDLYGEESAMVLGRKVVLSYLCGRGYRRSLRAQAAGLKTEAEFQQLFQTVVQEGPTGSVPAQTGSAGFQPAQRWH